MAEREWSTEEIVESLRQWDSDFYSDSETKWLMSKAADALTAQSESCDGCKWSDAFGHGDCYHCKRRFTDLYTARTNEKDTIRQ